jgi:hypothetical protein
MYIDSDSLTDRPSREVLGIEPGSQLSTETPRLIGWMNSSTEQLRRSHMVIAR